MNLFFKYLVLIMLFTCSTLSADVEDAQGVKQLLDKPLVERYVLDELKDLRVENMRLRNEVERRNLKNRS
ncbi:MAG: hypothetical protein PHW89_03805 [Sulfurimonas denitrificans]|jgi:hypothetical protein|nr:hypothetical protein [Sulfurimonas denitrificans]